MEKPFAVFRFATYYPVGGWNDCVGRFETFEAAEAAAKAPITNMVNNAQVVDLRSGEVRHYDLYDEDDD